MTTVTSQDVRHHLRRQRQRLEAITKLWLMVAREGVEYAHLDEQAAHLYGESCPPIAHMQRLLGVERVAELGGPVEPL